MKHYAAMCHSHGHAGDTEVLSEAEVKLRAGLVLVHEAMLYESAITRVDSKMACQKTLLVIDKSGLATDVHPALYKMCRDISRS